MTTDATQAETGEEVLQADHSQETKPVEATAESSPASAEQHEEKTDGVQDRINKITAEKYEAKREAQRLQEELEAFKQQQTQATPVVESEIKPPALPSDQFDEDAMKQYHEDMIKYTNHAAEVNARKVFESQQKQVQESKQQAQAKEVQSAYINNAIKDGVDLDKLAGVEQTLNNAGISPQLGQYIMNDPNGAKIASHLADNPALMYDVLSMDPVSAGIKIATEIKTEALSQTPKVSNAPEPIETIQGGGYVEKDEFETKYPGAEFI